MENKKYKEFNYVINWSTDMDYSERKIIEKLIEEVANFLNIKGVMVNNCVFKENGYKLIFVFDDGYKYETYISKIGMLQLKDYNYLIRFEANILAYNIKTDYLKTNKIIY